MWHVSLVPFFAYIAVNKMPNTVKLFRAKVNVFSLITNIKLVRLLAPSQRCVPLIRRHSSKPAGGSVQGGVRSVPYSHHSPVETVKWFPLKKSIVGRQLFGVFGCPVGCGHRKLSSTRSLQSRHISSKSVMSSNVSPSRLAKVELLEPVSMALSSDV